MVTRFITSFAVRLLLILVMLILGMMIGVRITELPWAEDGALEMIAAQPGTSSSQSSVTAREFYCSSTFVIYEWVSHEQQSVMLGCVPGDGDISFFAQPASDSKRAARILSIALTARATGNGLTIFYDPEQTNLDVIGCNPAQCRNITGVRLNF